MVLYCAGLYLHCLLLYKPLSMGTLVFVVYNIIPVSVFTHSYLKRYLKIIIWKRYLVGALECAVCSVHVRVRARTAACYRTVVYSLSLCAIRCSWLSSDLIWDHLIPRCLFPLSLISVSHKQAKSKASTPAVINILFLSEITSHRKHRAAQLHGQSRTSTLSLATCLCGRPLSFLLVNS